MKQLIECIREAERKKNALPHFNVGSLEQLKAIAHVGIALNVPIIIGVSEGERAYLGTRHIVDFVASYNHLHAKEDGFYLYLNADHTHSLESAEEAARAGFDAVLFDAGKLPFKENIRATKEAVESLKTIRSGIVVEGELGYIGSSSEILTKIPEGAAIRIEDLTTPEMAKQFVEETNIDLIAPAVGNIHGMYETMKNPALHIERIRELHNVVHIPLVLHGGSGVSDDDFVKAIDAGISVIHISTELRYIWRKELENAFRKHPMEIAPSKIMPEILKAIEDLVEKRTRLFLKL